MKILVTVGTTAFDSLIEFVDNELKGHDFVLQTGPGNYQVKNHNSFSFDPKVKQHYDWADLVISHAGAGSTFRLLELKKPLILVPNLQRIDHHQSDLANFMQDNNFAIVVHDFFNLADAISRFKSGKILLRPFEKVPFFGQDKLNELILQCGS